MTDVEAIEHRKTVTKKQPSLPNRAGKLCRRILGHVDFLYKQREQAEVKDKRGPKARSNVKVRTRVSTRTGGGKIYVRAVARQEIDEEQLADALLDLALQMRAEEKGRAV
jgi:hypothetical protein